MAIKDDAFFLGVGIVAIVAVGWYAKNKIAANIPQVVKDGAQAAGQLASLAGSMVTSPLDTFGIVPDTNSKGVPNWTMTTPWTGTAATSNDPVSNNDTGMNFNYF